MKLYIVTGFSRGPLSRAIAFTVSGRSYVSKHRTLTSPFFLARLPTMFNLCILFRTPYRHVSAFRPAVFASQTLPHTSGRASSFCENTYHGYINTSLALPRKAIFSEKLYTYKCDIRCLAVISFPFVCVYTAIIQAKLATFLHIKKISFRFFKNFLRTKKSPDRRPPLKRQSVCRGYTLPPVIYQRYTSICTL